jgi:hypothetical protein
MSLELYWASWIVLPVSIHALLVAFAVNVTLVGCYSSGFEQEQRSLVVDPPVDGGVSEGSSEATVDSGPVAALDSGPTVDAREAGTIDAYDGGAEADAPVRLWRCRIECDGGEECFDVGQIAACRAQGGECVPDPGGVGAWCER